MSTQEARALVKIIPFRISHEDIKDLPDDQKALFGLLNYAASEINVLQRVYLSSAHSLENEAWLDYAILIQRNTLLRLWSAKLFELLTCMEELSKKAKLDEIVRDIASTGVTSAAELRSNTGYEIARNFRNESTNHYSFKAAKKNLSYLSPKADLNLYLHEAVGNSWYPMGEELMFVGRLNRHSANLVAQEAVASKLKLNDWMEWNLKANEWVRSLHSRAFELIVKPDKLFREAMPTIKWVKPSMVSDNITATTPLFCRKPTP